MLFRSHSHSFYHFSELVRTVFRYSHGFHLWLILARIQQFSGTHTHSTIFPNWSGQFFCTRTNSTFCRYWPGFNNFPALTLILPFFRTGPDSFSLLARIRPLADTGPDATIFRYSHSFYHFSVLVRTVFGTRRNSTFSRYSTGSNNFPALTLILPSFRTGQDSFSVLARIPPFAYTGPDSTFFRHSH